MKNRILDKWMQTGLLQKLDLPEQTELANLLELMAEEMVQIYGKTDKKVFTIAFPVVRRLFDNGHKPNANFLLKDLEKWLVKETQNIDSSETKFDVELELCKKYCSSYGDRFPK